MGSCAQGSASTVAAIRRIRGGWGAQGAITQGRIRMSERLSLKEPSGANPAWLAVPLVVFALITLTVGLVARQTVREPYATPFLPSFLRGYPPDEGVAGDGSVGAGMWSVTDGRTHR